MRKSVFLLAVSFVFASSLTAQMTEFGVIFGGSKRVIGRHAPSPGTGLRDDSFTFSNSAIDLYYAVQVDPGTMFKIKLGRIEGPIGFREEFLEQEARRDVEGEVQHLEGLIEYRFSEPFGSAGLFAGVGLYRHEAEGFRSQTDYGFAVGVTADFPLSRRYGVILDGTYHFTKHDFDPRYLTIGAGLRLGF